MILLSYWQSNCDDSLNIRITFYTVTYVSYYEFSAIIEQFPFAHPHPLFLSSYGYSFLSGPVFKSSTESFTHSGITVSTRPLKYREYTQSHLEQACKAVREGLSVRRAAEEYQIPKSTIQDHISGKVLSGSKSGAEILI